MLGDFFLNKKVRLGEFHSDRSQIKQDHGGLSHYSWLLGTDWSGYATWPLRKDGRLVTRGFCTTPCQQKVNTRGHYRYATLGFNMTSVKSEDLSFIKPQKNHKNIHCEPCRNTQKRMHYSHRFFGYCFSTCNKKYTWNPTDPLFSLEKAKRFGGLLPPKNRGINISHLDSFLRWMSFSPLVGYGCFRK